MSTDPPQPLSAKSRPHHRALACLAVFLVVALALAHGLTQIRSLVVVLEGNCTSLDLPIDRQFSLRSEGALRLHSYAGVLVADKDYHFGEQKDQARPTYFELLPIEQDLFINLTLKSHSRLETTAKELRLNPAKGEVSGDTAFTKAHLEWQNASWQPGEPCRPSKKESPGTCTHNSEAIPAQLRFHGSSQAADPGQVYAALTPVLGMEGIDLLRLTQTSAPAVRSVTANGCLLKTSDGPDGASLQIPSNRGDLEWTLQRLDRFSVRIERSDERLHLAIAGHGLTTSLRFNGREVLPTKLQQILEDNPERRGALGVLVAFVFLAVGVFAKQALDILVEHYLPKPK